MEGWAWPKGKIQEIRDQSINFGVLALYGKKQLVVGTPKS
jgi:hypothetical protein